MVGIEPSKLLSSLIKDRLPSAEIHNDILENIDLPKNHFDVIAIRHVLEHLNDLVA